MLNTLLHTLRVPILIFGLVMLVLVNVTNYQYGNLQRKYDEQAAHFQEERVSVLKQNNAELTKIIEKQAAQNRVNEKIAASLQASVAKLHDTQVIIQRSINDAITQDGNNFNGIGAHSLRLYTEALGYPAYRDIELPGLTEPFNPITVAPSPPYKR